MFDALTAHTRSKLVSGAQDGDRSVDELLPRTAFKSATWATITSRRP
jgi:hypothetical protein